MTTWPDLNYGWMPTAPFLRRFQFIWWPGWLRTWGWRQAPVRFARCTGSVAAIFKWITMIGPLEIRRWSDR
jgi:hypothetical protein